MACSRLRIYRWLRFPCIGISDSPDERDRTPFGTLIVGAGVRDQGHRRALPADHLGEPFGKGTKLDRESDSQLSPPNTHPTSGKKQQASAVRTGLELSDTTSMPLIRRALTCPACSARSFNRSRAETNRTYEGARAMFKGIGRLSHSPAPQMVGESRSLDRISALATSSLT
ncbi:hypothetical protein DPMN_179936 [Dreissena polymorpha]|uniref:Uncharacterized protein n=1 Tax=Dreissena polymorpha TaxID=45954 RepID=A0A9D4IMS7_DREPO|nr:hypothetical protein DPMN_179936 [Dreissena polymorpha]